MQIQHFRLQRVFDVQLDPFTRLQAICFSFETDDGRRCLSVTLPGRPRLQPCDTVTVVLRHADDWQTLQGWKNETIGEVILRRHFGFHGLGQLVLASCVAYVLWHNSRLAGGGPLPPAFLGFCGLALAALAYQQWRAWRVRQLLTRSR